MVRFDALWVLFMHTAVI